MFDVFLTVGLLLLPAIGLVAFFALLFRRRNEWRDRDAAGALDPSWDYEVMVGSKRRAAIAKARGLS